MGPGSGIILIHGRGSGLRSRVVRHVATLSRIPHKDLVSPPERPLFRPSPFQLYSLWPFRLFILLLV